MLDAEFCNRETGLTFAYQVGDELVSLYFANTPEDTVQVSEEHLRDLAKDILEIADKLKEDRERKNSPKMTIFEKTDALLAAKKLQEDIKRRGLAQAAPDDDPLTTTDKF